MAIFTNPDDQARQAQRVQFRQAEGADKLFLAMSGYNASGQKNTYGKIMGTINPVGDIMSREIVKSQFGENTDVGRQIRATDQEFYASKQAQGKFFLEAAKLAVTAGAGAAVGAAGAAGTAGTAATTTASTAGSMTSVLGSGGSAAPAMSGSVDPSMFASQAPSLQTMPANYSMGEIPKLQTMPSSGMASTDVYKEALKSDAGQKLIEMKEESAIENTKDELAKKQEQEQEDAEEKNKLEEGLKTAAKGIPLVGSGVEWYQKGKVFRTAEKNELKKALGKTVSPDYNLL